MNHMGHDLQRGMSLRDECLIDIREVCRRTGMSKTSIHKKISEGRFPRASHRDGPRWVRWRLSDIMAWIANNQSRQ